MPEHKHQSGSEVTEERDALEVSEAAMDGAELGGTTGDAVVIRMYDVGFGAFFPLFIPVAGKGSPGKVRVDCGSIRAGARPMPKVVRSLVKAARDDDGGPGIGGVTPPHRHKDHVSG